MLNWGDRFAFGFHDVADGGLGVFTGHASELGLEPLRDIRAMLFWRYLFPRHSFVTSTGNAMILIGTGITADEWELAKVTTTAHVLLLLCRAGVGQCTDPRRRSLLHDPGWEREWQRIAALDGRQASAELEAGIGRWNGNGQDPRGAA